MASIRKRGKNWFVEIRKNGVEQRGTFPTKSEAQAWATQIEADILAGKRGDVPNKTFGDLLTRYRDEVSITKRGERWERMRINLTLRDAVASVNLREIDARDIAGMRAGEIAGLTWDKVFLEQKHCKTAGKTAAAKRDVPLSAEAIRLIQQMPRDAATVFDIKTSQIDALFRKAKTKAMIDELHFHDLRHTAVTRLAKKLDVLELARMIGHRDLKMLMVYYNESAENLAGKL